MMNPEWMNKKERLKQLLTEKSFQYSDTPKFKLVSGAVSQYYIDCKMTTLLSHGKVLIGEILFEMIKSLNIKGIGGLTLGSDPIANAVAFVAGLHGLDMISFVIRKEAKKHGTQKWIEGDMRAGDRVVVIDDVITTGGSTIKAIDRAEEAGLTILKTIVLVDREEGGRENILARGYDVEAVFTKSELRAAFEKRRG
ncbi:MAG: orotate phosphoribosyltransferase [Thermodesulfobacteriota bacterium]